MFRTDEYVQYIHTLKKKNKKIKLTHRLHVIANQNQTDYRWKFETLEYFKEYTVVV
jgi:putative component of toxin-antitoxin plasmid stabilization module